MGAVVLVFTLALVNHRWGRSGGQGDGDHYLTQLKVAILKVVLDVDVAAAGAVFLRPTVD